MGERLRRWIAILRTQRAPEEEALDAVSRWLLITRASVLPMTGLAAAVGGLLALAGPSRASVQPGAFFEALLGLLLAHAANNMSNDWFDARSGVDREGSLRTRYAPHPLLSGLVSRRDLALAILVANVLDLAILLHLAACRGWPVWVFAGLGLFLSVAYVAPPLQLKRRGLGEPTVFLVWGPLMVGGTYYVTTGSLPPWVLAASLPYGLLVASVLIGKHIDKLESDRAQGVRTLPVILGEVRARWLVQVLLVSFFVLVGLLVLTGTLGAWCLLVFAATRPLLETVQAFGQPRPPSAPPGYPVWPLWHVAWAFRLTRLSGSLLVAGLAATALYPVFL